MKTNENQGINPMNILERAMIDGAKALKLADSLHSAHVMVWYFESEEEEREGEDQ